MTLQLIINAIVSPARIALVATGFPLILNMVRFFHFAHGAVFTIASYLGYVGTEFDQITTHKFFGDSIFYDEEPILLYY